MKDVCFKGYVYGPDALTPDECWEVATFVIDRLSQLHRNLDMRLMMNGFNDYLQWKTGNSANHWHNLLEGRMAERVVYKGRADSKADEKRIALAIHQKKGKSEQKVAEWKKQTGLSQAAYYRALKR